MEPDYDAYQIHIEKHLQDINPVFAGDSKLRSGEGNRIETLNCTVIHYITEGCGTITRCGRKYNAHKGQGFICLPGETVIHTADLEDPWSFAWVGFTGKLAEQFAALPSVFDVPDGVFNCLLQVRKPNIMLTYQLAAELMMLYSRLLEPKERKQDHVQAILDYIQTYYMRDLTVKEIASYVGLNQQYLCRIFKEKTGCSIQQQILNMRFHSAKQLLMQDFSVKEAANLSGFHDGPNFSKLFKRVTDKNPTQWRIEQQELTRRIRTEAL